MNTRKHTTWKTLEKGIRFYDHTERRHGVKPDRYFALRYVVEGKRIETGLGWASEGWTLNKVRQTLAELRLAQTTGTGPVTLEEKRQQAKVQREIEQAKPTIAGLWAIYQQNKGRYSNKATDTSNFTYFQALHDRLPETLRTHEVTAIAKRMEEDGKAPQTVRNALELLRRLVNFGAKQELCPRPTGLRFDMPKIDNQRTECLTPEQAKVLFEALDADPDQNLAALMRLALATGMRRGALFGLQWSDIDFRQGIITLRGETAKKGKTEFLPMTEAARNILQKVTPMGSEFVFPGKNGGKRVEIRRFLNRIREAAGLPADFRPLHGLRHTYASWLASSGKVDLFTLQKLMTHESPLMTQRYSHLADEAVKRAASVIDECFDAAANAEAPRPQGAKVVPFIQKEKK